MSSKLYRFKICIFGDGGVGKTTLVNRYLTGVFDDEIELTFGMEFYVKKLEIEGVRCVLQVWDFAGEREFRSLLPSCVIDSSGGIFMFDISRYSTVKNLEEWVHIFKQNNIPSRYSPVILVGGKLDLKDRRVIPPDEGLKIAGKHEFFKYIECSSVTGENVENVFTSLVREILVRMKIIEKKNKAEKNI
jgi:small GTP-binding protein